MNPRFLFFIIFGVVVLGGMFFVFKPQDTPQLSGNKTSPQPSPKGEGALSPAVAKAKTFSLEVKGGKLVSGPEKLTVTEGDTVTIVITADEAEELHVHGYDKSVDLEPNKPAKISFVADKAGRFPYELEHAGVEIGAIEVMPK